MTPDNEFRESFGETEPPQWSALRQLSRVNFEYFVTHIDDNGTTIASALDTIPGSLDEIWPLYEEISEFAPSYDFDKKTPGNGYRSFIVLIDKCILHCTNVCRQLNDHRHSLLFRKAHHAREMEACSQLLAALCYCLHCLKSLHKWRTKAFDGKPSLFISDEQSRRQLLDESQNLDRRCFYGRCLGFQFCDGMRKIFWGITTGLASYSEVYYTNETMFKKCGNCVKYLMDPEARASRIVDVTQRADINFCQTFWFLNECRLLQMFPSMTVNALAINQSISVPPEKLRITTTRGKMINIPIPSSHIGNKPIYVKLLSAKRRKGMIGSDRVSGELLGPSDVLLIHCHGGGFVSQTSKSHEVYLRNWAVTLDVPILTIDYSLAPEAPFPRALEEVVYAYVWALTHGRTLLGTTAGRIIFTGDSAGANLMLAAAIRCIELNIKKPDGIFMAYTPVWVESIASPSRLLCLTDPLLPFGFMMRCLKAYAGVDSDSRNRNNEDVGNKNDDSNEEALAKITTTDLRKTALGLNEAEAMNRRSDSTTPDSTLNPVSFAEFDDLSGNEELRDSHSKGYTNKFIHMYKSVDFDCSATSTAAETSGNGTPIGACNSSDRVKWPNFLAWFFGNDVADESRKFDIKPGKCHLDEFVFSVPQDPLISPYLAPDSILSGIPPVKMVTLQLDPCLDDSVMFGRKLKSLGNDVSLDILPELPHGFLNLCAVSKEAYRGSKLCIERIRELINAV